MPLFLTDDEYAQIQADKHQIQLQLIGKDEEIERLRRCNSQLLQVIKQKDLKINKKDLQIVELESKLADKEIEEISHGLDSLRCEEPADHSRRMPVRTYEAERTTGWTVMEEEKLYEAVLKYTRVNHKISWTEILKSGEGVFAKGRTSTSLNQKWRHMCSKDNTLIRSQSGTSKDGDLLVNRD